MSSVTGKFTEFAQSRSLRDEKSSTVEREMPTFISRFCKNTTLHHKTRRASEGTRSRLFQSTENLLDSKKRNFNTAALSPRNSQTTLSGTLYDSRRKGDTTVKQNFRSSRFFSTSQPNLHLKRQPVDLVGIGFEANRRQVGTQFSEYNKSQDSKPQTLGDSLKDSECSRKQFEKSKHIYKEDNLSSTIKTATSRENQSGDFAEMKDTQQKLNYNQNIIMEPPSFIPEYSDLDYESTTDDDDYGDDDDARETDRTTIGISNFNNESNFVQVINNPIRKDVTRNTLNDIPSGWDGRPVIINHLESKAVLDGDQVILSCRIIGTWYNFTNKGDYFYQFFLIACCLHDDLSVRQVLLDQQLNGSLAINY